MKRLGRIEIEAILPQRGRMLLCREAEIDDEGVGARATLDLNPTAWPESLLFPRLFVVEALAQL